MARGDAENEQKETWSEWARSLLYYHTVKVVQIKSWKLGLLHYGVMLLVATYVVLYAIVYEKGYQEVGNLVASTTIKLKGIAVVGDQAQPPSVRGQVWDAEDVVFPPKEPFAAFATTNFFLTERQQRGICTDPIQKCPCQKGKATTYGYMTGNCNASTQHCEINAWCDPEPDLTGAKNAPQNQLIGVSNFTVFIRVNVKFPKFDVSVDNAQGSGPVLGKNLYHIQDILKEADSTIESSWQLGAAVAVIVEYQCDLDHSLDECQPEYKFVRIDDPSAASSSHGYNFRHANFYRLGGEITRDLFKLYGIRMIFLVSGQAGKFSIVPLLINVGSGMALLSIATVICDLLVLYVLPNKEFYNKVKYETINEVEDTRSPSEDVDSFSGRGNVTLEDTDTEAATAGRRRPESETSPLLVAHAEF